MMIGNEIKRFKKEKTFEILAEEIANYMKDKLLGVLFDTQKFNELTTKFWDEKYPFILNKSIVYALLGMDKKYPCRESWDEEITSVMRKAEGLALIKFFELLSKDLTEWALNRNIMRLTKTDVKLFLASKNFKLSTSFEQMFYRIAKLKYRYVPPWMRE